MHRSRGNMDIPLSLAPWGCLVASSCSLSDSDVSGVVSRKEIDKQKQKERSASKTKVRKRKTSQKGDFFKNLKKKEKKNNKKEKKLQKNKKEKFKWNEIEAKIQGLKQKLVEQLDSMSDDEDFLTIRTEAEELMNDFAEDLFQEISQPTKSGTRRLEILIQKNTKSIPKEPTDRPEALPQIGWNLPKRPKIRERLALGDPARDSDIETGKRKSFDPEGQFANTFKFIFSQERLLRRLAAHRFYHSASLQKETGGSESRPGRRLTEALELTSKVCVRRERPTSLRQANASASSLLLRAVAERAKRACSA
ncbi:unnamed protein product [Pieris macdunnoughi]|uniref:Uncharacterized protein n=1 Tax=Pieris macdunnoughi TaxID=345717 RepID=A0A821TK26_9NEOP|nr:unnamed protein product [Pieris macdunnoughi]